MSITVKWSDKFFDENNKIYQEGEEDMSRDRVSCRSVYANVVIQFFLYKYFIFPSGGVYEYVCILDAAPVNTDSTQVC